MKGKFQDGGPAFPIASYDHQTFNPRDIEESQRLLSGMSLRQHYAGQAMQGMVSSIVRGEEYDRMRHWAQLEGLTVSQWIARDSFKQADAMLAELDKDSALQTVTKERDELANAVLAWWERELDAQSDEHVRHDETPEFITIALAIGEQP